MDKDEVITTEKNKISKEELEARQVAMLVHAVVCGGVPMPVPERVFGKSRMLMLHSTTNTLTQYEDLYSDKFSGNEIDLDSNNYKLMNTLILKMQKDMGTLVTKDGRVKDAIVIEWAKRTGDKDCLAVLEAVDFNKVTNFTGAKSIEQINSFLAGALAVNPDYVEALGRRADALRQVVEASKLYYPKSLIPALDSIVDLAERANVTYNEKNNADYSQAKDDDSFVKA